jgi:hypothetical protein
LKFPLEVIFRTRKYGNSFISLPFPHNALLESPIGLASCRQFRRHCSIKFLFCQPSGGLRCRNPFEQSRFSNSQCGKVIHRVFILSPCSRKYARDRSKLYATLLCVTIANIKRCTLSFSRFAPLYGRLFRPLSPIVISVTTVRHHDIALPSISATVFTTPVPHALTIVELRVAYTRYPTGSTDRYSPAAIIKANPFTQNLHCESSISIRARHHHYSCPLKHLFHPLQSPRASCSPVFVSDVKKKLGVDRKQKSIQAATHDSVFGRARVVSLDIVRDVPLYRRRIMSANSYACAHSSPASSRTEMR